MIVLDWTEKPPVGTPIRNDGHWSVCGLTAAYFCNESGGRALVNQLDGTSAPLTDAGTGTVNFANDGLLFNGVSTTTSYVPLNSNYVVGAGTLFALFKFDALPAANAQIVSAATNRRYLLVNTAGKITTQIGSSVGLTTAFAKSPNVIHDTAVTWNSDSTAFDLYVDGSYEKSGTAAANTNTPTGFNIGSYNNGGSSGFAGMVYLVLCYNRPLSAYEIASLSANPWQVAQPRVLPLGIAIDSSFSAVEVVAQSSCSATLSTEIRLAAGPQASAGFTADLTNSITLASAFAGSATLQGDVATEIWLTAEPQGSSTLSAEFTGEITLACDIQGSSILAGEIATAILLAAQPQGNGSVQADLVNTATFAAAIQGTSTLAGGITTVILLAAQPQASSTVVAALTTQGATFGASIQGLASLSGDVTTDVLLAAEINGEVYFSGALYDPGLPPEWLLYMRINGVFVQVPVWRKEGADFHYVTLHSASLWQEAFQYDDGSGFQFDDGTTAQVS